MGINDIPQSKIAKFAKVLGTTPAHLMGWVVEDSPPEEPQLSEEEKILLDLFNRVPEDQQQMVLKMIRVALGNQEQ